MTLTRSKFPLVLLAAVVLLTLIQGPASAGYTWPTVSPTNNTDGNGAAQDYGAIVSQLDIVGRKPDDR